MISDNDSLAPEDSAIVAAIEAALEDLLDACTGSTGALLATDDGYVVAEVLKPQLSGKTLAAVSASLLGLAESMAAALEHGACQNVIIESEGGLGVCLRVGEEFVLTAVANQGTRLGMLLSAAKVCTEKLNRQLAAATS